MVKKRDESETGQSTEKKRELRAGYLPPYTTLPGADAWEKSGQAVIFEPIEKAIKK
jgi:hypothetical protein